MQDYYGPGNLENHYGYQSAMEFENMLKKQELGFIDLFKADEVFNFYLDSQDLHKARQLIEFARRSHPFSDDLFAKEAQLELEHGHTDEALECVNQALYYNPMQAEYVLLKSEILAQLGQYDDAMGLLSELAPSADAIEEVLLQMGNVAQLCGQLEESEQFYRQALQAEPSFEVAAYELCCLLESQDRYVEAIELYQKLLDHDPYLSEAWYQLGILLGKTEQYEHALEALGFATAIRDDHALAYYQAGAMLMNLERYEEALTALLDAASLRNKDPFILYHLGECYEALGDYRGAARYYQRVLRVDAQHVDALIGLGYCMERSEDYIPAINYYQKALRLEDGNNEELRVALAICEYKLGNLQSAFDHVWYALGHSGVPFNIWMMWIEALMEEDNFSGAAIFLEEAVQLNPDEAMFYYMCAACHYRAGDKEKAMYYFENSLLLAPGESHAVLHLAPEMYEDRLFARLLKRYVKQ